MTRVRGDECFIKNQRGVLKTRIQIADDPLVLGFAQRQAAVLRFGEVGIGPLQLSDMRHWRGRWFLAGFRLRHWGSDPDVALDARFRSAGTQRVERINCEWQMLKLNINGLNRL